MTSYTHTTAPTQFVVEDFVAAYTGEVAKLYPNIAANPTTRRSSTTATTRGSWVCWMTHA